MSLELRPVDRFIWKNELEHFVPSRVIDFHTHIFDHNYFKGPVPDGLKPYPIVDLAYHKRLNKLLLPRRQVAYLVTGWPDPSCDLDKQNNFVLEESRKSDQAYALMNVSPSMKTERIESAIKEGFIGFKPYKCFSTSSDPENARIQDFLPRRQISLANKYHLVITLHLSRKKGISDLRNLDELQRLKKAYPNVIWNLAHCGRIFFPENLEKALPKIRKIFRGNIFLDTSAVNDSEVFYTYLTELGPERVLYGSDNLPVGALRGRCVGFGYDWAFVTEDKCPLPPLPFGPIQPSLVLYEELRAIRRAALRADLSRSSIERIFHTNAERILHEAGP